MSAMVMPSGKARRMSPRASTRVLAPEAQMPAPPASPGRRLRVGSWVEAMPTLCTILNIIYTSADMVSWIMPTKCTMHSGSHVVVPQPDTSEHTWASADLDPNSAVIVPRSNFSCGARLPACIFLFVCSEQQSGNHLGCTYDPSASCRHMIHKIYRPSETAGSAVLSGQATCGEDARVVVCGQKQVTASDKLNLQALLSLFNCVAMLHLLATNSWAPVQRQQSSQIVCLLNSINIMIMFRIHWAPYGARGYVGF
jgi:hypothetical protein